MNFDIDQIKAENDIQSVARRLGLEIIKGGQSKALTRCFRPEAHSHGDRTPSAVLDSTRQTFRCWVCDDKPMDAIGLVMAYLGCDFKDACEWLGGRKDVEQKRPVVEKVEKSFVGDKCFFRITKTKVMILETFVMLCDSKADEMFSYMKTRGITEETCAKMGLVYCKSYIEINAIMRDSFSEAELRKAGLISVHNEKGNLMPFGNRIIYPFYHQGRVVYLQGRSVESEPRLKKISLGGTIPCLYNTRCIEKAKKVWLCEGCEDTLTAIQMGNAAVGILGVKGFKQIWAKQLRGKTVYIVMDNDKAGLEATEKIGELLTNTGVRWVNWTKKLPEKHDLNEWYVKKEKAS